MTIKKPSRITATGKTKLSTLVARIKDDVQSFANNLSGVVRDTATLAPLVATAFRQFRDENSAGTKLEFIKLLATPAQLKDWPETDAKAKESGSPVQSLFNGVEYLLRKAAQLERKAERDTALEKTMQDAAEEARRAGRKQGLTGDALATYVEDAQEAALQASKGERLSQDDIAEIIWDGWYSNMDDFDVFRTFAARLVGLKFSEKTTKAILDKAEARIKETQEELEKHPEKEKEIFARPPIPFRQAASVAA